jgi:cyclophilin family peptidyl-prolyl cis-trans isomerase/HEAT repeat protein
MVKLSHWPFRARLRRALLVLPILVAAGCGDREIPGPEGIPVEAPEPRPYDGLLDSPELQEVVKLAVARDRDALVGLLNHDDPRVRARAAFSLASIPDLDPEPLVPLLADPEGVVRADAAFALGRTEPGDGDGGASLVDALRTEEEPVVRRRILEALGHVGNEEAMGRVLALGPGEDGSAWTWALTRSGLRGVRPPGLVEALLDRLSHQDPAVRAFAAYYFGRGPDQEHWADHSDRVREALDGYERDEPAAMHLVLALARQRDRQDGERLLGWLEEAEDWRIRVNAARALGATAWLEGPGVRAALFRALEDESEQVGATAALALTRGFWVPPDVQELMERHLEGSTSRWRTQVPFLRELAQHRDPEPVLAWTRRMRGVNVRAVAYGLAALGGVPGDDISDFIMEAAGHPEPLVRAAAFAVLADRWLRETQTEEQLLDFYRLFVSEMRDGPDASAVVAARILVHPAFLQEGAAYEVEAAYRLRLERGDVQVAAALVHVLGQIGDDESMALVKEALGRSEARIRRAAFRAFEEHPGMSVPEGVAPLARDELELDWGLLASLGPEPRLRLRTGKGTLVIRLAPDQAPLTVQTLARQARDGVHDGVLIHRLEPNFVFQAGDVGMGDGRGGPGYAIRTELTWIPFRRGAAGMASLGWDTEASQYFVTHSLHHHLEGQFTAFGWVESGSGVLDHLLEGDRILEMTVEPGPGE